MFGELALQGAPMQAETARGFRDIAVALGQHAVDVFPFQPLERRRRMRQGDLVVRRGMPPVGRMRGEQGVDDSRRRRA